MPEPPGGTTLEFMGEVRLRVLSEEGKRLKDAPAALIGESTRAGPSQKRRPGLLLANCAHRLFWHSSSGSVVAERAQAEREFLPMLCSGQMCLIAFTF